jgi:hypothetical protein
MEVDRVRPHFEIDVGSGFILDVFGRHRDRFKLVTSVRATFAARVSQGGSHDQASRCRCARRLRVPREHPEAAER